MKNMFLFAGQGSQYSGMGKELLEKNPEMNFIFETASDILGFDLKKICFEADEETLSRTVYSQPAIMAVSLLCFETAKKNEIHYEGVCGHSLGEYSAMTACGMVSLEDGFRIIKARSEAMEKASRNTDGSMSAILKISPAEVERVCGETEGYVVPVNYNSPIQTVIAGERNAVEKACEKFRELKARVMPLKVASAFHSELMKEASEEFYENIKNIKFNTPENNIKYFSNVTGNELTDFSDMNSLLKKHMVSPVRFTDELENMKKSRFECFIELGSGKVLTGLVKKTLSDVKAYNIENNDTLEAFLKDYRKEN